MSRFPVLNWNQPRSLTVTGEVPANLIRFFLVTRDTNSKLKRHCFVLDLMPTSFSDTLQRPFLLVCLTRLILLQTLRVVLWPSGAR